MNLGMLEKLIDRAGNAATVDRVGVQVAQDHERFGRGRTAEILRGRAPGEVVGPEPDLIVVALGVATLGAVECRRCRMTREQVDDSVADFDRDVQVVLG